MTDPGISVPAEWGSVRPEEMRGTVLVIGPPDSGKSTFSRWLIGELCRFHPRVGWIDADMGQSTLGLPATMNLAVLAGPAEPTPAPSATFFVGDTSPSGHMLPVLVGNFLLRERAMASGATAAVVDTTGLVTKESGGGELKTWKIELLRPSWVVAFRKEAEMAHLLEALELDSRLRLVVLPVPGAVRPRTQAGRAQRRRESFVRYFQGALPRKVRIGSLPVYGVDLLCPRRIVAFQGRDGFARALGIVLSAAGGEMTVLTPLSDFSEVFALRVGTLIVDPETGASPGGQSRPGGGEGRRLDGGGAGSSGV
jgi:polynucleotide 5'-hydroxyl-kinase GRC3/NOL9